MLKNMDEAAAAVGQMSTLYQACMMCAFGGRIDGIDKYEDLKEQVRYFGIVVFNTCMPSPFALHSSYLDIVSTHHPAKCTLIMLILGDFDNLDSENYEPLLNSLLENRTFWRPPLNHCQGPWCREEGHRLAMESILNSTHKDKFYSCPEDLLHCL